MKLQIEIIEEIEEVYYVLVTLEDGTNWKCYLQDGETVGSVIDEYLKQYF